MKVTNEKTENHEVHLLVEMDPEEVAESSEKAFRRLVQRVNVPGFRKGKAPRAVLETYVGREQLVNDMVDELVPGAYEKALEEQQLDAIAQPRIEVTETDPVTFRAVVPLRPVVNLGDYHQIRVTSEPMEVTEETIDSVIEELRHQHATWEPAERTVELKDLVTLDVESTVDGEPYVNRQGAQYQVLTESLAPAPGFAEQLVGMSKGEEKEFSLQFSDEESQAELAGKEAHFKASVSEIKEEKLPEVTDEFATQVEAEIEDMAKLRERIRTDLEVRAETRAREDLEMKVIEALVEASEVAFPPVLIETEVQRMMGDQARSLQMQGLTLEQYLTSIGKTEEEVHQELHPLAEKRVAESLALMEVSEEESVEVVDGDVDDEIARVTADAPEDEREDRQKVFNAPQVRESIRQTLLTRRTVQILVDIAQGPGEAQTADKEEK